MKMLASLSIALVIFILPVVSSGKMLVGYDQFCGVPVVIVPNPQDASADMDQFNNPVIYVDPSVMANSKHSLLFVLAHECGHIKLGHIAPEGQGFRHGSYWATREQEFAADCWATIALMKAGYGDEIMRTVEEDESQGSFHLGPYPSGRERREKILSCLSAHMKWWYSGG